MIDDVTSLKYSNGRRDSESLCCLSKAEVVRGSSRKSTAPHRGVVVPRSRSEDVNIQNRITFSLVVRSPSQLEMSSISNVLS